jgi:type VI secretion system secreted protein VgrG
MTSDITGWELLHEGGWADRADDAGGPTNRGITLPPYSRYLKRQATKEELRAMTVEAARAFYWWYMEDAHVDEIADPALRLAVFDAAVTAGASRAWKLVQAALGFPEAQQDGIPGPMTFGAMGRALSGRRLALLVCAARNRWLGRIISGNHTDADRDGMPDNAEAAAGWLDRTSDLIEEVA